MFGHLDSQGPPKADPFRQGDFTSDNDIREQNASMEQRKFEGEQSLSSPDVYVSLTYDPLDAAAAMARVKSPKAGAVVLFAGPPAPFRSRSSPCD